MQVLQDIEREAAPKIEKPPPVKFNFQDAVGASIDKGGKRMELLTVKIVLNHVDD